MAAAQRLDAAPGCVWKEYSNQLFRRCCAIKNCQNKRKNGRCGLARCHLEYRTNGAPTGRCQDYILKPD
jgi:hypothetical protein